MSEPQNQEDSVARFVDEISSVPSENEDISPLVIHQIQYTLDLRKPNLRKNLDLRKVVGATDFLVHKLFDLRKIF